MSWDTTKYRENAAKFLDVPWRTLQKIENDATRMGVDVYLSTAEQKQQLPRSRKWGHEMLWIAEDLRGFIRDAGQLKVTPTADAMWDHVLDLYPNIKPLGMTAFREFLHVVGISFKKRNDISSYMERPDVVQDRHEYLYLLNKYDNEGYVRVYGDETWVNSHDPSYQQ